MSKKAALITIHGMGDTPRNYNTELAREINSRLGSNSEKLYIGSVFYQEILQENENLVWGKVATRLKWDNLRKFILFGLADAAGLENGKESLNSVYSKAQTLIAKELLSAYRAMDGDGAVVILAQSLGCHVASCYFWDAINYNNPASPTKVGIWQDIKKLEKEINEDKPLSPEEISFLQGKTSLKYFYTTGCNIPIFVAAHLSKDIIPIKPNNTFEWHNFYDKDDVLGWPLAELSDDYKLVANDHRINSGGGFFGWIFKSWNPLSHDQYWLDDEVLDPLEEHLKALIDQT